MCPIDSCYRIVSTLLSLQMATSRLVGRVYVTAFCPQVVFTYYKKSISLKKQRNQDARFCSLDCNDLAVEVLPPSCTLLRGKWAVYGRFGWTLLLNLANTIEFVLYKILSMYCLLNKVEAAVILCCLAPSCGGKWNTCRNFVAERDLGLHVHLVSSFSVSENFPRIKELAHETAGTRPRSPVSCQAV